MAILDVCDLDMITKEDILALVSFRRTLNGKLVIAAVHGDIKGKVRGNIEGDLEGNINGDITGGVRGSVGGHIRGDVLGHIKGAVWESVSNVHGDVKGNVCGRVTKEFHEQEWDDMFGGKE